MADSKRPTTPGSSGDGQPPPADAFEALRKRRADQTASAQMFALSGVGFEFIAAVGLLTAIGWWIDRQYNTSPWFVIVGVALGFTIGLMTLIRFAKRTFKSES